MAHATPRLTQFPIDPKDRPIYSKDQLQTYFKRVKIPQEYLVPLLSNKFLSRTREHGLPFLHALTRYHVCNVPFENLELHYSTHKTISLDMDDLYTKFAQHGRGGRCMENNSFFGTVLRSLGFDVRNCGGRVSRMMAAGHETRELQGQTYDPWNHMLNLVRLDNCWFVVDVGMGAMGPNIVYPLEDGYEAESIAPRRIRLQRRCIPERAAEREEDAQQLWCFDVCFKPDVSDSSKNEWVPTYCFTETEFLPQDYEMMSWWTSTSPKSFFTYVLLCTKMIQDEESEKIIGDVSLVGNSIKRKIAPGQRDVIGKLKSEEDRVKALKDIFDIDLTPEEQAGISLMMRTQ
ncbi:arylamine N-acetyltransferase 1 [Teratosphaeria nubilosa]|uniref:Arylamine N-acetyltransferase 1 n=1 Tax=Teratosphaeria nubilosa TaxID=161662 RepID=A0A6G1KWK5_9PEZI|nr:arylamine N-acetyltransferase 1 [Teratosphaeria nubilosa]